jgi:hypothetical protein
LLVLQILVAAVAAVVVQVDNLQAVLVVLV